MFKYQEIFVIEKQNSDVTFKTKIVKNKRRNYECRTRMHKLTLKQPP